MTEKLAIPSPNAIQFLKIELSAILWKIFYANNSFIDSIELYKTNYSFSAAQDLFVKERLSFLNFKQTQRLNTVLAYNNFLLKFPNSKEASLASFEIEGLEIKDALLYPSVSILNATLKKYPYSSQIKKMEEQLANLYFHSIDKNSSSLFIMDIKNKLEQLTHVPVDNFIDSCNFFLIQIEFREVYKSNDLSKLNAFIDRNGYNKQLDMAKMTNKRNQLIVGKLLSEDQTDFVLLQSLVKDFSYPFEGMNDILTKVSNELKGKCIKGLKEFLNSYIEKNMGSPSQQLDPLCAVILKNCNLNISIDQRKLFSSISKLPSGTNDELIDQIVDDLDIFSDFLRDNLYIKPVDDNWNIINLIKFNKDGLQKKSQWTMTPNGNYELLPEIKIIYPIYAAIRSRYNIYSFSIPKVIKQNELGFEVLLYGYNVNTNPCCPNYEISIQYKLEKGTLLPVNANYVNNYYSNLEVEGLEGYFKIGKNLLPDN